jgi:hypothetical protein
MASAPVRIVEALAPPSITSTGTVTAARSSTTSAASAGPIWQPSMTVAS